MTDQGGEYVELREYRRGAATPKPLVLVHFADIAAELNQSALVKGLLTRSSMSVCFGESSVGKTAAVISMAVHVAAGQKWCSHPTQQGPVVYVAGEASAGVRNRLVALKMRDGFTGLPLAVVPESLDLRSGATDTDRLIDACERVAEEYGARVSMIIVDTLSRALAGGNESASEDMGALVMHIDRLRQATGAHVLLVHHSGKDAARGARGHSLLRAAVDTEIEIVRPEGSILSTLRVTKQRDISADIKPISFKLVPVELGRDRDGDIVSAVVMDPIVSDDAFTRRPKGKPPSPRGKKFHSALLDALVAGGRSREESAGRSSVTIGQWRSECVRLGLIDPQEAENRQRALLSKYRLELIGADWVACNGELIWSLTGGAA